MGMLSENLPQAPVEEAPSAPVGDTGFPAEEWTERVDAAAGKILYGESGSSLTSKIAGANGSDAVAQTTADLIINIDDKLGGKIPEEDILPAAAKVLERVVELREKSTGTEMSEDEIKQALAQMMQLLAQEYGTTPEQAQEFASEFDEGEISNANQMFGGDQ